MAVVWVRWRWRGALKYIRWRAGGAVTQTKLVLTHPNTVRSQRSGALAVKLFYKEIVVTSVFFDACGITWRQPRRRPTTMTRIN